MEIPWVSLAEAAISGGGVGWLATFLNDKSKSRSYAMGAVDQAVKVALNSVTNEVSRLNCDIGILRKENNECNAKNARLQKELDELRDKIDELMKGEIPGYVIGPKSSLD